MLHVAASDRKWSSYRCTPATLAAFRQKLLQTVPDAARTHCDVMEMILNDAWFLGMVHVCAVRRWRGLGRPSELLADLRSETLCRIADRCLRHRAHGFQVAQADHVSGFWTTVIRRAMSQAWVTLAPREVSGIPDAANLPGPDTEDESVAKDADRLLQAIFTLPPRQKAVMVLRATQGLDLHAIARQLNLSYDQVRYANLLAVQRLQRMLSVPAVPA